MKAIRLSLASFLLATSAMAQALPEAEELAGRVGEQLPPYWSVAEFRLIAQSDLGDAARPRSVIRFEADAAPTSPLFVQVEQQDPFVIVAPTHDEGGLRTLYGVIDLTFRAGVWSGEAEIENPVSGLGRPADLFDRPILVLGDPEADARIAQMRESRESNAVARFERQLTLMRDEHEAALAQLRQEQELVLETARREHAAALVRLTGEMEEEVAQARARHGRTLQQLARDRDAEIADLRAAHEAAVTALHGEQQALEGGLEAEVDALRKAQADQIAALTAKHEATVAALRREQEALEGGLEAEVAALRRTQAEQRAAATAEHETAMRSLEQQHRAALQAERGEHRAAMEALQRELQTELLALTEGLEPEVEAARQEHARTMAELSRSHEAEMEELRVTHARARGQMRERLREDIAAAEFELTSEVERLRGQLGRSEEAQALQAAFLQSVRVRSAAALELQRELETALARRVSVVQQLPLQYQGGVRCRDTDLRIDRSWQLALDFREVNPSGMRGNFLFDGRSGRSASRGTANLVLRGEPFSLPLQVRLSLAGASDAEHIPNTIDLVMSESVVMRGTETTTWTIDNERIQVSCVFEFS